MKRRRVEIKKVESLLSRRIRDIYQERLEQKLDNISYRLFDRTLIIMLEGTITSPEMLLKQSDRHRLVEEVRDSIDSIIHPQIQDTIENILNVKVVDFLSDTTIENNMTGAIAIFEFESEDI